MTDPSLVLVASGQGIAIHGFVIYQVNCAPPVATLQTLPPSGLAQFIFDLFPKLDLVVDGRVVAAIEFSHLVMGLRKLAARSAPVETQLLDDYLASELAPDYLDKFRAQRQATDTLTALADGLKGALRELGGN